MCIRSSVTEVRVFSGRTSSGVRGIRLGSSDKVISMSMLRHTDYEPAERAAYLRMAKAKRIAEGGVSEAEPEGASAEPAVGESGAQGLGHLRVSGQLGRTVTTTRVEEVLESWSALGLIFRDGGHVIQVATEDANQPLLRITTDRRWTDEPASTATPALTAVPTPTATPALASVPR